MRHTFTPAARPHRSTWRGLPVHRPLTAFFALAFGISWPLLIADALGAHGIIPFHLTLSGPGLGLALLMSYGPTIAALIVTAATAGTAGIRSLLGAAVRWRVRLRWYALVLAGPAVLFFVASRVQERLGGTLHPLPAQAWALIPMGLAGSAVHSIGNGEEIGWRGFALPHLMRRYRALTASLLLGSIWAAFHIPIMIAPGGVGGSQSFGTFLPFFVGTLATSVLATWIYRNTGGSVLLIILFHGALNTWPDLFGTNRDPVLAWAPTALLILTAALVVARCGPDLFEPSAHRHI